MKRIASILCLVISVTLAGCNAGERRPSWGVATEELTTCGCIDVPPTPVMPTAPLNLDTYRWGTPLYRGTLQSAWTTVLRDPNNTGRFMVWAFDVRAQRVIFWATGSFATSYSHFQQQKMDDLLTLRGQMLPDFWEGGTDQYPRGPVDPGPGPGIHDAVWLAAYKEYKSSEEQLAPLTGGAAP